MNALLLAAAVLLLLPAAAGAYEEPGFEVVARHPGFELRRYPAALVVETEVAGPFGDARNAAFRRLFKYISGANRERREVAMTAPVTSAAAGARAGGGAGAAAEGEDRPPEGREVAMTVPVTTAPAGGGFLMRFFLPRELTAESAPEPTDPAVRVRLVPERWVAVRAWSGRASEGNSREQEAALLAAVRDAGLATAGAPEFAVYDGPFTLWFLRRNESWVEVQPPRAP